MTRMLCPATAVMIFWAALSANGGDWRIGAHGGLSVPQLSSGGNEVSTGYCSILAPSFGVTTEYCLADRLSVLIEANHSGQGGARNGFQPITQVPDGILPLGQYLYADFDNRCELTYLEIPVMLRYQWISGGKWHFFAEGGLYAGFLLSAKQKTSGYGQIYSDPGQTDTIFKGTQLPKVSFDANTDIMDDLNKFNWGITAGAGVAYSLNKVSRIYLDIRGEYGLIALQKDKLNGESNTGCALFLLGYDYSFGY